MGEGRRSPGELEAAVMRVLWDAGRPLTAGEVRDAFSAGDGVLAFTTLLTVLNRLHVKKRVDKAVSGEGNFVFSAAESESAHAAHAMTAALLAASDRGAALLKFAGTLDARDVEVLRRALEAGADSAAGD